MREAELPVKFRVAKNDAAGRAFQPEPRERFPDQG